jgi:hypothetical protein
MTHGETNSSNTSKEAPIPGARVVQKKAEYERDEQDQAPRNPIFEKIRSTLQRTEPDKWRRSGDDFNSEIKHPKPIDVWETLFLLSIKEGNLVLRCSIPLRSEYFGGGYTLTPATDARYSVELREKGWNPRELTDPFYANSQKKHLKMQRLVEGKMARVLFEEVKTIIESFNTEKRRTFERECFELMSGILSKIAEMDFSRWRKDENDPNIVRYSALIQDMSVDVARVNHGDRISFHLKLGRDGMYKSMNSSQIEAIFLAIEEIEKNSSLEQLSQLLESFDLV